MDNVVTPLKEFGKNSVRLVKRCTKPDRRGSKTHHMHTASRASGFAAPLLLAAVTPDPCACCRAEFNKITIRTALGFVVMGFIGFFVSHARLPS